MKVKKLLNLFYNLRSYPIYIFVLKKLVMLPFLQCPSEKPHPVHGPSLVFVSGSLVSNSVGPVSHQNPCLWDAPGTYTGVGTHSLLQGLFPTQGLNPSLLHCWRILYHLQRLGKPTWTKTTKIGSRIPYLCMMIDVN